MAVDQQAHTHIKMSLRTSPSAHSAPFERRTTAETKSLLREAADLGPNQDTFRYKNLEPGEGMRVMWILPGSGNAQIRCALQPCTLPPYGEDAPTKYTALSYWWGDDTPRFPITVGQTDAKGKFTFENLTGYRKLHVRSNLLEALKRIRHPTESVPFWTDAICMNQKDFEEKEDQVRKMHRIYNLAEDVMIWLGFGESSEQEEDTFKQLENILDLKKLDAMCANGASDYLSQWSLIAQLMKNRWFSRRWVIQEVTLAKKATVYFGSQKMDWKSFSQAIALFSKRFREIRPSLTKVLVERVPAIIYPDVHGLGSIALVDLTINLFRKDKEGNILQWRLSLEALVSSLQAYEASEPRDIVYALLALAKDTSPFNPYQDWTLDMGQPPTKAELIQNNRSKPALPHDGGERKLDYTRNFKSEADPEIVHPLNESQGLAMGNKTESKPSTMQRPSSDRPGTPTSPTGGFFQKAKKFLQPKKGEISRPATPLVDEQTILSSSSRLETQVITPFRQEVDPDERRMQKQRWMDALTPNYQRTILELCTIFMEYCIWSSKSLDILCRNWAPVFKPLPPKQKFLELKRNVPESTERMPSWLPSIANSPFGMPKDATKGRLNADSLSGVPTREYQQCYYASGNLKPDCSFGKKPVQSTSVQDETDKGETLEKDEDCILRVRGIKIGMIVNRSKPSSHGMIHLATLDQFGWDGEKMDHFEEFWRILVADRGPSGAPVPAWYTQACLVMLKLYQAKQEHEHVESLETQEYLAHKETPTVVKEFLERVQSVIWKRRFVEMQGTRSPYKQLFLGLAPEGTKKMDIVCVLFGCSVPVVLRDRGGGYYEFIGECYIHGMMDGESVPRCEGDANPEVRDSVMFHLL